MKKIIAIGFIITVLFSTGIAFASDNGDTSVPPCPEEYRDGLKP